MEIYEDAIMAFIHNHWLLAVGASNGSKKGLQTLPSASLALSILLLMSVSKEGSPDATFPFVN